MKIAASLWSADLGNLAADILRSETYVDSFHIDVSDGRFTSTLLFFPDLVAAIRGRTKRPLEIHLLTCEPQRWIEPFADAGGNVIIFSPEASDDPKATIAKIRHAGCRVGLCLGVKSDVAELHGLLPDVDLVVVMGTKLGIKGVQEPSPKALENIRTLDQIRRGNHHLDFEIEVDGAVRHNTVGSFRQAGVDIVVPGSLLFGGDLPETAKTIRRL